MAILAKGRLVASGALSELLASRVRGWEMVLSGLTRETVDRLAGAVTRVTPLGADRYTLELPLTPPPDRMLSDLVATGASLVSLTPISDTLEDLFVSRVADATHDRGLRPA